MLKMNNKETDKNILALGHIINIELLHWADLIKSVLKFKKSKEWETFAKDIEDMQDSADSYIEKMEKALVSFHGAHTINASRTIAQDRLDSFIKQDNLFKELILYRGKVHAVEFLIDNEELKLCNISPEPTKKGVIELVRKLEIMVRSKFKIKKVVIKSLLPLNKTQLQHMEGEYVKNTEGLQYVVDGVFRESKQDMVIVKREHKLTSEEFTRKFRKGSELIGNWSELEGR